MFSEHDRFFLPILLVTRLAYGTGKELCILSVILQMPFHFLFSGTCKHKQHCLSNIKKFNANNKTSTLVSRRCCGDSVTAIEGLSIRMFHVCLYVVPAYYYVYEGM